jgi:hypothetical protein
MILISKLMSSKKTNEFCILSSELWMRLSQIDVFGIACFMKITAALMQIPNWTSLVLGCVAFIKASSRIIAHLFD